MDLSAIAILDHHCHTLRRPGPPLFGDAFRRFFAETTDPLMAAHIRHTVFYMRMLRDVAALFGCAPSEEALLELRAATPPEEYARRLFDAGNFRALLVDTGYRGPESYDVAELSTLVARPVETIIRLESLMEELIATSATFAQVEDALAPTADGRNILKGTVTLDYRTTERVVVLNLPGEGQRRFKLRLPASPTHSDRYSPWHLADGIVSARGDSDTTETHDAFAIRYRVL